MVALREERKLLDCSRLKKIEFGFIAAFLQDNPLWFSMPVYECSLAAHIAKQPGGKLPVDKALDIAVPTSRALAYRAARCR